MYLFNLLIILFATSLPVAIHSAPVDETSASIFARDMSKFIPFKGVKNKDHYMVAIKKDGDMAAVIAIAHNADPAFNLIGRYASMGVFSAKFNEETFHKVLAHHDVDTVHEDGFMSYLESVITEVQTNAGWGLARLSSRQPLCPLEILPTKEEAVAQMQKRTYSYSSDSSGGECADIYVVDSGIRISHQDFGGRATFPKKSGEYEAGMDYVDEVGHGTLLASIAMGRNLGVAKKARAIGVKVGSKKGVTVTNAFDGLDWVFRNVLETKRPSVVLYAAKATDTQNNHFIDAMADILIKEGIHFVAAAGNSGVNADTFSPARLPQVIAVGASTWFDRPKSDSNWGPMVDLYAPGNQIAGASFLADDEMEYTQGTSPAAAHVAGLVAHFLCLTESDHSTSPAAMQAKLIEHSLKDVLHGLRPETPNRLAHIKLRATGNLAAQKASQATPDHGAHSSAGPSTPAQPQAGGAGHSKTG